MIMINVSEGRRKIKKNKHQAWMKWVFKGNKGVFNVLRFYFPKKVAQLLYLCKQTQFGASSINNFFFALQVPSGFFSSDLCQSWTTFRQETTTKIIAIVKLLRNSSAAANYYNSTITTTILLLFVCCNIFVVIHHRHDLV